MSNAHIPLNRKMSNSFLRRKMVIIIALVVIFSFTSFAYAGRWNRISNSQKTRFIWRQSDVSGKESFWHRNVPPVQETKDSQADMPLEQTLENSQSEGFISALDQVSQGGASAVSEPTVSQSESKTAISNANYPMHTNISTTLFWVGEEAGEDNKNISNLPSAWDEEWASHFGGIDDPKKRSGYLPSRFTPKENPFYFALPYNDFDKKGNRKKEVYTIVPWVNQREWKDSESVLKNQWIKISKNGRVAYAQWEDVGPFNENDAEYVFGNAQPKSKANKHAGLDVSPAVHDFLGLSDMDLVDWQFVDASQVPDGPWMTIRTTSQTYWK